MVKNLPAMKKTPGSGRAPGAGHGNPLRYCCLESPHGQRSLAGYSPRGLRESGTPERLGTRAGFTFGILSRPPERSALCILLLTHLLSQFLLSPGSEFLARPTGDSQLAPRPVSPGVWGLRALRSLVVLVKPQAGSGASCSPASGLALSILAHSIPSLEHLLMGDPKVSGWRFGKHCEARLVQPQSPWLGTLPPDRRLLGCLPF